MNYITRGIYERKEGVWPRVKHLSLPKPSGYTPWNKNQQEHICLFCKNKFTCSPSIPGTYCSVKCRAKGNGLNRRGKNNNFWKGGENYSLSKFERNKFGRGIYKSILERDNYTCQICGVSGVELQVDHIQPWVKYIEGRFDINNCRTLCVGCHYFITYGKKKPKDVKWGFSFKKVGDTDYV